MAKTSAETTLGEDIHTRTTGDSVESQAVVLAIDGSDAVVPAHATDGLSVKITNASLAATLSEPISIDDNGGSITVDGTFWQATQPVSLSEPISVDDNGSTLSVDDGGGTLTVDGTVALDAGSLAALETITASNVTGNVAHSAVDSGNPVKIGGVATDPSDPPFVAYGDRANIATDEYGQVYVTTSPNIGDGLFKAVVTSEGGTAAGVTDSTDGAKPDTDNGLTVDGRVRMWNGTGWVAQPGTSANGLDVDVTRLPALPAGSNNIGDVDVLSLPALPAGTNNIGDVDVLTMPAITGTVTANAGTGTMATQDVRPSTSSVTSVDDTASSVQLLASTAGRLAAMIFNDSAEAVFVKFGTTASATSFTVKILAGGYFEFPQPVYTGRVDAIWNANSTGAAKITELTA